MPPLAIAAALTSALIHASWNAALKGGRGDRIADAFLIAVGGMLTWGVVALLFPPPPAEAWAYLLASVLIHLVYWYTLFNAYDAGRAFLYKATKEIVAGEAAAAKKNGGEMPLLFEAKDG